jgi:hypothetical protein
MRILVLTLSALVLSCSGAPPVEEGQLRIQLVDLEGRRVITELTGEDAGRVKDITSRLIPSEGWAMTPPPWNAALVVRDEDGRERVFQLTAAVLRENTKDAWSTRLAGPDGAPSDAVQDYDLAFEDEEWLWSLFARHLGPTKVKQYQAIDDPALPKL